MAKGVRFVLRTFTIVPQDDGNGYEVRIDPALPDGTVLEVQPTYEQASHWAIEAAKKHGGGINQTHSRRRQ